MPSSINLSIKTKYMREILAEKNQVAFCGLYCGACKKFLSEKCPGCAKNEKASWCKVRACCLENSHASCAECVTFADPMDCKKFNNFISRAAGFVLRSDRAACIARIKAIGLDAFAAEMAEQKIMTIGK
jgi:hypothetical protein